MIAVLNEQHEGEAVIADGHNHLEPALMALLERARDSHDAAVTRGEAAPTGAPKILDRAE